MQYPLEHTSWPEATSALYLFVALSEVFIGAFEWFHNNVRVVLEALSASGLTLRKVKRVTMHYCRPSQMVISCKKV